MFVLENVCIYSQLELNLQFKCSKVIYYCNKTPAYDFKSCTSLDLHLFADDSNFFSSNKDLKSVESVLIAGIENIVPWLCANKLSLNVEKSNFVSFLHATQKIIRQLVSLKYMVYCIK